MDRRWIRRQIKEDGQKKRSRQRMDSRTIRQRMDRKRRRQNKEKNTESEHQKDKKTEQ